MVGVRVPQAGDLRRVMLLGFFSHIYWSIIALKCSVSFCCITK